MAFLGGKRRIMKTHMNIVGALLYQCDIISQAFVRVCTFTLFIFTFNVNSLRTRLLFS